MSDPFYPTVDLPFFEGLILSSGKVIAASKVKVGDTTTFVQDNNKAMHKRIILIRELEPNQVSFEIATGWAIKLGFMGQLLTWFEEHRNWKDGGYFVP